MQIIDQPSAHEFERIVTIWESSVRATHHFLTETDIQFYKSLVQQYLPAMELYCIRVDEAMEAFMGISDGMVQALFVNPEIRGKGLGKQLMLFAINNGIKRVDVNEQNQQAVDFYKHLGFSIIGRNELDGSGKPYPILMLELRD